MTAERLRDRLEYQNRRLAKAFGNIGFSAEDAERALVQFSRMGVSMQQAQDCHKVRSNQ